MISLGGAPILHLTVNASTIHAEARRRSTVVWAGEAAYESLADLSEAIARLAAEPPERCQRLSVALERSLVQLRTLKDVPPVKDRELAALVAHRAGRFFRRNGAPLVTDAVWVKNGTGRVVHAAAAAEPLLLAIVAGAREAGLVVERIAPANGADGLLLLPTVERATRVRAGRRLVMRLAMAAAGSWVLAGLLFGTRLALERRAIERELAATQAPLGALLDARRELRSAEATVLAVADARRGRGRSLAALVRVARAMPDSSVITSFTWRADGTGVVAGAARRAADVLARLERNGAVRRARFEGPVVRERVADREWERFTILFGGAP